ncbi:MAG: hypothetical protein ACREYE_28800 [Gammaproteobacteria bacterium]
MNKVTGKILMHETGVGIPNLVVTVYDVDFDTLPQEAIQSKQASLVNFWEQLQGDRLGSVLSDRDGTFVLEYEDKELKEKRPDLLLFVTAPEGQGLDGCSPILHVSCGIRQNAGRIESYLIRLTADELNKAGVPLPSVPAPKLQVSKAILIRLIDMEERRVGTRRILEKVRAAWSQDNVPTPKISQVYSEKVKALQEAEAKNRIPANGFRLALPMIGTGGNGQARMAFDGEAKKWFMQRGDERAEIKFGGIVSADEMKPEEKSAAGINVVLDEQKKEFRFVISRAPVRLCMTENSPGELFVETFRRRFVRAKKQSKRTESVRPNEANDR